MRNLYTKARESASLAVVSGALLVALAVPVAWGAEPQGDAPDSSHGIQDLLAEGPAPGLAADLKLFGQFVGDWDTRSETYRDDRTVKNTGSVHIGWILYGTALQDIWTGDAPDARPGYPQKSFGTTIRFFDDRAKLWRVIWIAPVECVVQTFVAREIGGEIVLDGRTPDGNLERWIWSHYTRQSFEWRSTESADGGKTWKITQRIWGRRHQDG